MDMDMRHLRLYENFQSVNEIEEICKKYNIKNYTINADGSVDVDGKVDLSQLTEFQTSFGKASDERVKQTFGDFTEDFKDF